MTKKIKTEKKETIIKAGFTDAEREAFARKHPNGVIKPSVPKVTGIIKPGFSPKK